MAKATLSCQDAQMLIMGMLDGELSPQQQKQLQVHLDSCAGCRESYLSFSKLKKDTSDMKFKKLPEMYWDEYWSHVYNRIERGISWILLSIGAMIFLIYGSYEVMHQFYLDPEVPILLKVGAGTFTVGLIALFVSVVREKWMVRKIDKYRSIER